MKLREFKEGIEKLGLKVIEDEYAYDIVGKTEYLFAYVRKNVEYIFYISRPLREGMDNWSKKKQEKLVWLCAQFAITELEER